MRRQLAETLWELRTMLLILRTKYFGSPTDHYSSYSKFADPNSTISPNEVIAYWIGNFLLCSLLRPCCWDRCRFEHNGGKCADYCGFRCANCTFRSYHQVRSKTLEGSVVGCVCLPKEKASRKGCGHWGTSFK